MDRYEKDALKYDREYEELMSAILCDEIKDDELDKEMQEAYS